ncbi:hypothetical protein FHU41_001787 [Psychromicrobium silvestre]|uniref:Cardiolipin synthase N-terminal domain-containing protein n=1 Tax=Psychromicrobium silvestre TaxID=1645614 RepID=A0A7Y9LTY4_9MICC|nr:PLD nuclease N-terminal domain-containing protein [Psychromicrobium silvestre]NYE95537.1 hypothetical protein [Psychromicrobium silvestre]
MLRYLPLLILLGLELYTLIDCLRSEGSSVRTLPKVAWVLLIIFLPLIGVVLWFALGRPQYGNGNAARQVPRAHPTAPMAPDDDPEFLRNLDVARKQKAEEERLRQLQAELEERERKLRDQEN